MYVLYMYICRFTEVLREVKKKKKKKSGIKPFG